MPRKTHGSKVWFLPGGDLPQPGDGPQKGDESLIPLNPNDAPVGMDTLAVVKALELLERERSLVILPAFYYGAASCAVEPPEGKRTVYVDADHLQCPRSPSSMPTGSQSLLPATDYLSPKGGSP